MRTLEAPGALPPLNILIEERQLDSELRRMVESMYPLARRLELPVGEAGKLLRLLSYDRIGATDLYPGLDGVARGMRESGLWDTALEPVSTNSVESRRTEE